MKDLAERFAELRNAIMRLPGNPSCDDRAGLRHQLLHLEHTLMSARGSLDDRHHCHCRRKRRGPVITANRPRRLNSALAGQRKTR